MTPFVGGHRAADHGGKDMGKTGKKYSAALKKVDSLRRYAPLEAFTLVKEAKYTKFDESVDVAARLNVDPKYADQMVRGSVSLPKGLG